MLLDNNFCRIKSVSDEKETEFAITLHALNFIFKMN